MTRIQGIAAALVFVVMVSGFQVIYSIHQNRQAFMQLQELEQQQDLMKTEWGQLQLEQATWATHGRIEKIANHKLEMIIPPMDSVLIIQP